MSKKEQIFSSLPSSKATSCTYPETKHYKVLLQLLELPFLAGQPARTTEKKLGSENEAIFLLRGVSLRLFVRQRPPSLRRCRCTFAIIVLLDRALLRSSTLVASPESKLRHSFFLSCSHRGRRRRRGRRKPGTGRRRELKAESSKVAGRMWEKLNIFFQIMCN